MKIEGVGTTMRPEALFSLNQQVALVTGAAGGLGLEMARALAGAGATVILAGRKIQPLHEAVALIASEGGQAAALPFDLDDEEATAAAIAQIANEWGRLDVLVACAGVRDRTGFAGLTRNSFAQVLHTNLVATADLCHAAAQLMAEGKRGGRIIVIGSMISSLASAMDPAYLASKAGLSGMVRALAVEYGPNGITANEIAPGSFATEYNAGLVAHPEATAMVKARTMVGRWGQPWEIAGAALFLASPSAAYVTGHRLVIDGGMSVKS